MGLTDCVDPSYPESVHSCYKKFHSWLFLETYVGSAVGQRMHVCVCVGVLNSFLGRRALFTSHVGFFRLRHSRSYGRSGGDSVVKR